MRLSSILSRRALTASATALTSAAILGGGAIAQQASPPSEHVGPSEGYPVGIYQGTCDEVSGEPAYQIGDAISFGLNPDGNQESEPQTIGAAEGVTTLLLSVNANIDTSLQDLGQESYVIAAQEGDTVVACGQIAGAMDDQGNLGVAIPSTDEGSVVGVAILSEGDGQTQAQVYLFNDESADLQVSATPQS